MSATPKSQEKKKKKLGDCEKCKTDEAEKSSYGLPSELKVCLV